MKLNTDPFPVGLVELMDKKVLVRRFKLRQPRARTWSFLMNYATG
jgi:hypothetical protein